MHGEGGAYDLASIGGFYQEVLEAHRARATWDTDVVLAILRSGGRPPLLEVRQVIDRGRFREAQCVFRTPTGERTGDVCVPLALVRYCYPACGV